MAFGLAAIPSVCEEDGSVSPLSWFTSLSCADVAQNLQLYFSNELRVHPSEVTADELDAAGHLVSSKYATPAWINRLA